MVDGVQSPAAIGFRDHSGWAVAIVLAFADGQPRIIVRERIQIVSPDLPRQPYHAVAEEGAPRDTIHRVQDSARQLASHEIDRIQERVRVGGFRIIAAAVPAGTMSIPESLDRILSAHTLLHAAEGELYREALEIAAHDRGLRVLRFPRNDVFSLAARASSLSKGQVEDALAILGKSLGPPWQKDHREAAAAAWFALASDLRSEVGPPIEL